MRHSSVNNVDGLVVAFGGSDEFVPRARHEPQHAVAGFERVLQCLRVIRNSITNRAESKDVRHLDVLQGSS